MITKHLRYLRYVAKHKRYVYQEGRKLGVPILQLLTHDLSKFRPSEWVPYVNTFYGTDKEKKASKDAFDAAWLAHIHRNPHHWQHWLLKEDSGALKPLVIPARYVHEMLADWAGAGKAINGTEDVANWYAKNKEKMILHPLTRAVVETLIALYYRKDNADALPD